MLVSLLQKTASHNSYALVLPGWNSYHEIIDYKKSLFNKYDSQKVIRGLVFSTTPEKSGAIFIAKIEKNKAQNTVSFAILYSDLTTEHFQITDQTDFLN
jgi:secreted Zn-dependent insulinase-like peptidase